MIEIVWPVKKLNKLNPLQETSFNFLMDFLMGYLKWKNLIKTQIEGDCHKNKLKNRMPNYMI